MTKLVKDFIVDVIPGTVGTPGYSGIPATPGYWTETTVTSIVPSTVPTYVSQLEIGITDEQGRIIRIATYQEVQMIPSLSQAASNLATDPGEVKFIAAVHKVIMDQVATGALGKPLSSKVIQLPVPIGEQTIRYDYLAVWMLDGSYALCMFIGYLSYNDLPSQSVN